MLKYYRYQFKCNTCKKPFSETFNFIGTRRRYTDRFEEMSVKQMMHSEKHNAARNNGLTDDEVWSIVECLVVQKSILSQKKNKIAFLGQRKPGNLASQLEVNLGINIFLLSKFTFLQH